MAFFLEKSSPSSRWLAPHIWPSEWSPTISSRSLSTSRMRSRTSLCSANRRSSAAFTASRSARNVPSRALGSPASSLAPLRMRSGFEGSPVSTVSIWNISLARTSSLASVSISSAFRSIEFRSSGGTFSRPICSAMRSQHSSCPASSPIRIASIESTPLSAHASMPFARSSPATSVRPRTAAQCRAVSSSALVAFTSAPASMSIVAMSTLPSQDA
mmetsp:Transcript_61195/g.146198  ORF Transcript_61195/g.146198 Transcript_61195/m.146198 type:complete len:215 (+) Transcript_61195:51-695(+)